MENHYKRLKQADQERLLAIVIGIGQKSGVPISFEKPNNCCVIYDYGIENIENDLVIKSCVLSEMRLPLPTTEPRALNLLHELGHYKHLGRQRNSTKSMRAYLMASKEPPTPKGDYLPILRYEIWAWKEAIHSYQELGFSFSKESWAQTFTNTLLTYFDTWRDDQAAPPKAALLLMQELFARVERVVKGFLELIANMPEFREIVSGTTLA